MKHISWTSRFN